MNVRRAIPGDEPVLRALRLEALSDAPEAFGSTYARELARTNADWQRWLAPGVTLILEDGDIPRGLAAGAPDRDDPELVHLMAMWVHPLVRRTGAGDALVAALLSWALERGARRVQLMVISSNQPAQRLYARHGFRPTGQQATRERDGAIELQMERPLTSAANPVRQAGPMQLEPRTEATSFARQTVQFLAAPGGIPKVLGIAVAVGTLVSLPFLHPNARELASGFGAAWMLWWLGFKVQEKANRTGDE